MKIGVIRETFDGEKRVASTPDVVAKLVKKGFEVAVEKGAGEPSHFHDPQYAEAGAQLVDRSEALAADMVLSVHKPTAEIVQGLREKAILISHLEDCEDDGTINELLKKHITTIGMERIPRISRAQSMDALSSQSNISGYRAVIEAALHYGRFLPLMMTSAGSAKPARLVVLGAGAVQPRKGVDLFVATAQQIRLQALHAFHGLLLKGIGFQAALHLMTFPVRELIPEVAEVVPGAVCFLSAHAFLQDRFSNSSFRSGGGFSPFFPPCSVTGIFPCSKASHSKKA